MGRLLRYVLILLVLAALGGAIWAVVADLPAPSRPVEQELPGVRLQD